jgi:nucleoside-diphosphate-sugar epimerase
MSTVLVTGGSGFVGSHVILQLLSAGQVVQTTVRSLKREESVRAMLRDGGADPGERLSAVRRSTSESSTCVTLPTCICAR